MRHMGQPYTDSEGVRWRWDGTREGFPETDASIFDPTVRLKQAEMSEQTCAIFNAIIAARENAPPRVTGHETD